MRHDQCSRRGVAMTTKHEDIPATMLRYETEDKVSIITLDRADKLNAINSVMKDEIIAAFARADKEPTTSVIVLRANGRTFSAGFDLGHSPDRGKDSGAADPNTWDTMLHRSFDFGMAPWSTRKPVGRVGAGARPGRRLRAHAHVRSHHRRRRCQVRRAGGEIFASRAAHG